MLRPAIFLVACLAAGILHAAPSVAHGAKGAVASVHPIASRAGLDVLQSGGNAIDAAVAIGLTLGIVDGHDSGIGGGCFFLIRTAAGEFIAIDGREMAGAAATRAMYIRNGKGDTSLSQTGALAPAVPGALAAYAYALEKYGRKGLPELIEHAAQIAERGFAIDEIYARKLKGTAGELSRFDASRAAFLKPDGKPYLEGDTLKLPDLAASYRAIAREGPAWFYRGAYPQQVETWMKANGGILTAADFAAYHIVLREPVRGTYRGYDLVTFPPPSSGGVHVLQILNVLENFDVAHLDDATRVHVIGEAMKLAFADRAHWLGDPDFVPVPRGLVSKAYAKTLAAKVAFDHVTEVPSHGQPPDATTDIFAKHTTHFSVADADGNWVACTATINTAFGSKVVIPETGIVLNNQMDDFSVEPGVPNAFKLVGSEANAVAPGKRPLSSMAPTLVLHDGKPVLSLGAAGGPTIITQTVINLVGIIDRGLTLDAALAQPRFHHQWAPDELRIEETWPVETLEKIKSLGHHIVPVTLTGASNGVGLFNGQFIGASEPRVPGEALAW